MEIKDIALFAGMFVTLALGLFNLYFNHQISKRTTFVNTVTSERIKWISKVRENVSTLCSLCDQWMIYKKQDTMPELQRQIEQKKNEIKLQLNSNEPKDKKIEELLEKLPNWSNSMTPEDYYILQSDLIITTQALLKQEWDKVRDEAVFGDLRTLGI